MLNFNVKNYDKNVDMAIIILFSLNNGKVNNRIPPDICFFQLNKKKIRTQPRKLWRSHSVNSEKVIKRNGCICKNSAECNQSHLLLLLCSWYKICQEFLPFLIWFWNYQEQVNICGQTMLISNITLHKPWFS